MDIRARGLLSLKSLSQRAQYPPVGMYDLYTYLTIFNLKKALVDSTKQQL